MKRFIKSLIWLPIVTNSIFILIFVLTYYDRRSKINVLSSSNINFYNNFTSEIDFSMFPTQYQIGDYESIKFTRKKIIASLLFSNEYTIGFNLTVDYNMSNYNVQKDYFNSKFFKVDVRILNESLFLNFPDEMIIKNFNVYFYTNDFKTEFYMDGISVRNYRLKDSIGFVAFNDYSYQISYFYLKNNTRVTFLRNSYEDIDYNDNHMIYLERKINRYFSWEL